MASSLRCAPRSILRSPVLRCIQSTSTRPFSRSSIRSAEGTSANDNDHTQDRIKKGDTLDVESANAKAAQDAKDRGSGGNATGRGDDAGGKAKAKEEFPEAPDVAIGMQDERGGKGA